MMNRPIVRFMICFVVISLVSYLSFPYLKGEKEEMRLIYSLSAGVVVTLLAFGFISLAAKKGK
jgi:uncharacterized membrane protein